ncbi:DMT family transporter [Salibacterium salarium]|uniref:DMT family transporter n=1 Tax=Salibacterium salarium TaxID=284579 RepID=A0A428MTK4_9BACI|nr:DMT family transporter [Salibacterium salarium]RSL29457.1 DMT family transporter [Salibacterium salarium]
MDWKVLLAYIIAIILWASAFPAIKIGLESYAPLHLSLLRLLIASFGLFVFAVIANIKLPYLKDIPFILLLGFLGFSVYHTFLGIGELSIHAGVASLIVSTTPLFSAFLAVIFLKERFNKYKWCGSVIAFFGVAVITVGSGGEWHFEYGILMILIAAFGESFYFVFQSSYLKKYGFLTFTTYTVWAGTLFMLLFSPGLFSAMQNASLESTLTIVYLGLLPTVIPYFAIAYATFKKGASEATSSLYVTPAFAIIFAWLWLGEVPTIVGIIGGVITLGGVSL